MHKTIRQLRNGEIFPWERAFTSDVTATAIPIVIQSLFTAFMHIIDNLMIGQLGEIELAAVTQANRATFLFNLVIFGLSSGTATYVAQCYATVQKSTERVRLPMVADIVGLLVNTFHNYCLIFGNLGLPRLGVRGGAIATVVAVFTTFTITFTGGYIMRLATAAKISQLIPRSLDFAKKYPAIALPVIANEGLWSLGMVMYSVVYGRMGTGAVAAISIFNSVEPIAYAAS